MKTVAIVGIQGVPAKYGGFENMVENIIGENCDEGFNYTVFCSKKDYSEYLDSYKGVKLRWIPFFHANGVESIPYDMLSLCKVGRKKYDVTLILGVSGCLFLPIFRLYNHNKLIINIDGLEHHREKWGKIARWVLRKSEEMAVRYADVIISDNKAIQDYVTENYGVSSAFIAYGGDHVKRNVDDEFVMDILSRYNLKKKSYAISICRIEPENNSHIILDAFSKTGDRLIFIGNWFHSEYSRSLKKKYCNYENITMLDSIYDLDILYVLRSQCYVYIHGHSAGGTNPSLVEAMYFNVPIIAYDCIYNRETTHNKAYYFKNSNDIIALKDKVLDGESLYSIAIENYTWNKVAKQYEALY